MELQQAEALANEIIQHLSPYCSRIQVAGSIRRKKYQPRDIDIVLIPSDPWNLRQALLQLGGTLRGGSKLQRLLYKDVQVDLYYATPETWATLLLIRTGSKDNNIVLCSIAKTRGWHLSAKGDGLFDRDGKRIAGETELSIYQALDIPYQEPEERD